MVFGKLLTERLNQREAAVRDVDPDERLHGASKVLREHRAERIDNGGP